MENGLVTDGCDVNDSGSTFSAVGGAGGAVYQCRSYLARTHLKIWRLTKVILYAGDL